jgi:hypothetical protein
MGVIRVGETVALEPAPQHSDGARSRVTPAAHRLGGLWLQRSQVGGRNRRVAGSVGAADNYEEAEVARRRVLQAGSVVWAVLGAAVALGSLGNVNDDARLLVGVASVVGPLVAVLAAVQLSRHADRPAGVLLALSAVLTPTYFAYVINLPALVVGVVLTVAAHVVLPEFEGGSKRRAAGVRA